MGQQGHPRGASARLGERGRGAPDGPRGSLSSRRGRAWEEETQRVPQGHWHYSALVSRPWAPGVQAWGPGLEKGE